MLERTIRDHALRVNVQALKDVSAALDAKLPQIESAVDLDVLRGLEGDASADYFSVFDEMILTQKADFLLNGRNRRPPQDNMNALLSFAPYGGIGIKTSLGMGGVAVEPLAPPQKL